MTKNCKETVHLSQTLSKVILTCSYSFITKLYKIMQRNSCFSAFNTASANRMCCKIRKYLFIGLIPIHSQALGNFSITFSYARTAFLTQSSQGQSPFPVSIPLRSLHLVAPQFFLNSSTICLVYMRVLEPSVLSPAIMPAPTRAPQVASIAPMPTQKPVEIILS